MNRSHGSNTVRSTSSKGDEDHDDIDPDESYDDEADLCGDSNDALAPLKNHVQRSATPPLTPSKQSPVRSAAHYLLSKHSINGELLHLVEDNVKYVAMKTTSSGKFIALGGERFLSLRNSNLDLVYVWDSPSSIRSLAFVSDENYILAGLEDGKLFVVPFEQATFL